MKKQYEKDALLCLASRHGLDYIAKESTINSGTTSGATIFTSRDWLSIRRLSTISAALGEGEALHRGRDVYYH